MADEYELLDSEDVRDGLDSLDEKSERIIRENFRKLRAPYPGRGAGDKEKITWRGNAVYRLRIGRTWTAFHDIDDDHGVVRALRVLPIDDAHKEYGSL